MLLMGCSTEPLPISPEKDVEAQHIPFTEPVPVTDAEIVIEQEPAEDLTQKVNLQKSYENAIAVRKIMQEVLMDFTPEVQEVLTPALQSFSDDIDALQYYVDIAQDRNLHDEEHTAVVQITQDIEQAISLFSDILELLL